MTEILEFVPYKESCELKELGFVEQTYTWRQHGNGISGVVEGKRDSYNEKGDVYTALPTFSQAFKWFRKMYGIPSHIATYWQHDWNDYSYQYYFVENKKEWNGIEHYKTYEEAELACLRNLIDMAKEIIIKDL